MEEKKSYRAIFKEKMAEVHTPEEIRMAFADSFAACFALTEDHTPGARMQLFGKIWEVNPDAIIAGVDLFVAHPDPVAKRKQYLVISKNGTKESSNLLGMYLEESGVITPPWFINSKKRAGIKTCYRFASETQQKAIVHKANLLIDGEDLLLTLRHLSTADHARMKTEENAEP